MKSGECGRTGCFSSVIDESAVALGDEKDAFNVGRGVAGKVILQIGDDGPRRQIAHPKGMTGLFRLARRATRGRRDGTDTGGGVLSAARCITPQESAHHDRHHLGDQLATYRADCRDAKTVGRSSIRMSPNRLAQSIRVGHAQRHRRAHRLHPPDGGKGLGKTTD